MFQRLLERVYTLCVRSSLQVAMGIPSVSLSRRMSAVVPCLASSSAMQLPSIFWCPGTQMRLILKWVAISLRDLRYSEIVFIPVTRRVKGYTRFVGKYVTGRRKRFRPHKVYIFLIRNTSRVDLAMSVCPSDRLSVCPSVCPDER